MNKYILLFFLLISCASCDVSSESREKLRIAEDLMSDRPDSAYTILSEIDAKGFSHRKDKAKYALLFSMALDKNYIDVTDDSLIRVAVDYYDSHYNRESLMKALYYLGRIQYNSGNYSEAIITYIKANSIAEDIDNIMYLGMINISIAETNIMTYNDRESIPYIERAYDYFMSIDSCRFANACLYRKAQALSTINMMDEADSIYNQLLHAKNLDKSLHQRILCNYSKLLVSKPKADASKSISLFNIALEKYGNFYDYASWGAYAYALLLIGKNKEAEDIYNQLSYIDGKENDINWWKIKNYLLKADYKSAYYTLNAVSVYQDSILNVKLQQSTSKAQRDYFKIKNAELEEKTRNQQMLALIIVLLSIILVSAIVMLFKKRYKRIQNEKYNLMKVAEAVKLQSKNAIISKNDEINYLRDAVNEREKALLSLRSEYATMYKTQFKYLGNLCETFMVAKNYKDSYKRVYDKVQMMIIDISDDRVGQQHFEKMINKSLNNIMKHFREDFTSLNEEDYRFASYVIVGFDSITISIIFNMPSQASVYMRKSRMKRMIINSGSTYKGQYLEMFD